MANWQDRTLFIGDNLHVMRAMDSQTVDLIYLDPPFNSNRKYAAPIGSQADGAEFKDTWTLSDNNLGEYLKLKEEQPVLYALIDAAASTHSKGMKPYLIMMAARLIEMRRLLKDTGSLYLHCNSTAGHYLKLVLDAIFGQRNFITEIIWYYGTPSGGRASGRKPVKVHDTIFAYALNHGQHTYNRIYTPYSAKYIKDWFRHVDGAGRQYRTRSRKGKIIRQYLDESPGVPLASVWSDIMQLYGSAGWFPAKQSEKVNYPTQKPLALLERIIHIASNKGDVVLDPFCGCATTLVAAQRLDRPWVGVDLSPKAGQLVRERIEADIGHLFEDFHLRGNKDYPKRTDLGPPLNTVEKREYKRVLYGLQVGRCNGCNIHFKRLEDFHMDHIVARAIGGTDHKHNFQLLCGHCNSIKGSKTQAEFAAIISEKRKDFSWM